MQATLIYNPNATGASRITPDDIIAALRQAGYQPIYPATGSEQDLDRILQDLRGLVVVAGGDGSVRAVASRLLGNKAPLSILPLGAANNIARNLGSDLPPLEIIAGLKDPIQCFFDVGVVQLPWGVGYFLEAFGFGLYADTLSVYDPEKGKSVLRSITAAVQALSEYSPQYYRMKLDGEDLSGHFLIVEVLNTNAFGPRIKAAPDAHPDDGLFDVVRVNENERDRFMQYVTALLSEELHTLPSVDVKRGRKLEIYWTGFPVHLDAEVHLVAGEREEVSSGSFSNRDGSFIQVENLPKALEFWLPGSERKGLGACGAPRVTMS
jgi:diacylglycerol kinase family enzyme